VTYKVSVCRASCCQQADQAPHVLLPRTSGSLGWWLAALRLSRLGQKSGDAASALQLSSCGCKICTWPCSNVSPAAWSGTGATGTAPLLDSLCKRSVSGCRRCEQPLLLVRRQQALQAVPTYWSLERCSCSAYQPAEWHGHSHGIDWRSSER
jgi:hypothetical protein